MKSLNPRTWPRALWGSAHHELPPESVLLLRLIAIAWLFTGHVFLLPTRSAPFFAWATSIADSPVVAWVELVLGAVCALQLVLGRSMRASALVLGSLILTSTLLSRAFFSNNRAYTACLLILAALDTPKASRLLLRAQVIVLYLAASMDKLLDADWRSGTFMHSFAAGLAHQGRLWAPGSENGAANYLPTRLGASLLEQWPQLALVASWSVMAVEMAIAIAFLVRRPRIGIGLGLCFHVALLLHTGSPLGMFFYSATAAYLAFVALPERLEVCLGPLGCTWPGRVLAVLDPDGRCEVRSGLSTCITINGRSRWGALGLIWLAAHLPASYVAIGVLLSGPWFSPWSVAILVALAVSLLPFPSQPAKMGNMAG